MEKHKGDELKEKHNTRINTQNSSHTESGGIMNTHSFSGIAIKSSPRIEKKSKTIHINNSNSKRIGTSIRLQIQYQSGLAEVGKEIPSKLSTSKPPRQRHSEVCDFCLISNML
ncbi:unnamed protein product [Lathyrus sativus]|nr:unnamed protein product [Lathyrus sativus]